MSEEAEMTTMKTVMIIMTESNSSSANIGANDPVWRRLHLTGATETSQFSLHRLLLAVA